MGTNLVPTTSSEVIEYCEAFSRGVMSLTGCGNPETAKVIMLVSMQEGITVLDYSRKYHTINGKPSKRYDRMLVEFEELGHKYEILECTSNRACVRFTKKGSEPVTAEFTWQQAQESRWPWKDPDDHKKGLKDNWATDEDKENQLFARLVSKWIRRLAPSIVAGLYTPEETVDIVNQTPEQIPTIEDVAPQPTSTVATVSVHENDPMQQENPNDPPPAAQTEATFTAPVPEADRDVNAKASKKQIDRINQMRDSYDWKSNPRAADQLRELVADKGPQDDWSFEFAQTMIERLEALVGN